MNKLREKWYLRDSRYEKVLEQMQLLGIQDVTTTKQHKNGTITWKLPIKNKWNNGSFIKVGSFKSGYVRNNNSCYTNYQLNKRCESKPSYYEILSNGEVLYRKYTTRTCKLIPIEIDRLEYLISYCLKNYYIKNANQINESFDCGHYERISELEQNLIDIQKIIDIYKCKYGKTE